MRIWPAFLFAMLFTAAVCAEELTVGSKRFTESYILGEIIRQTAAATQETKATHKQGLGNTGIVFSALKSGGIDVYPEYVGTLDKEILKNKTPADIATLNQQLAAMGLGVAVPLGFNLCGLNSPWLATSAVLPWVFDTPQLAAGLFISKKTPQRRRG